MDKKEPQMHFGLNCRHLIRDDHTPADGRCAAAIKRYAVPEFSFLETRTPVPLSVAARLLGESQSDIVRRARAGELEFYFPETIAKRVTIQTAAGEREFTIKEAAKRLGMTGAEIERRITAGEMKAEYPDEFMTIVLSTRWDYEKCPLLRSGGICREYQPHEGPKIGCIADAKLS